MSAAKPPCVHCGEPFEAHSYLRNGAAQCAPTQYAPDTAVEAPGVPVSPESPRSAPSGEAAPPRTAARSEQLGEKTEKSATASPNQLESSATRDAPVCGVSIGRYVCVAKRGHTGRHKYRTPSGERMRGYTAVSDVARPDAPTPKPPTSHLRNRPLVSLSVQYPGSVVGALSLPVPFAAHDIEAVRRYCDYLTATFVETTQ